MSTTKTGNIPPERHALHELAGEYVLGTLSAARRREVEARLADDLQLQAAVHAWEDRLLPLTGLVEPVAPSSRLWARIERSLDALAVPAPRRGQGAQHVFAGQLVELGGDVAGLRRAHPMHSRRAARLRLIQAFTVPSGASSRRAISLWDKPST